jgi:photosystem II stability/assembly factor-like uncharacterized protein
MKMNKLSKIIFFSSIFIVILALIFVSYYIFSPSNKFDEKFEKVEKLATENGSKLHSKITEITMLSQWIATGSPILTGLGTSPVVSVVNQNIVFIAGGSSGTPKIYRSINGGLSFTSLPVSGIKRNIYSIWAFSADTIFVGDGGNDGSVDTARVYKTVNGGTNWTTILNTAPEKGFINGIVFSYSNPNVGVIHSDGNTSTSLPFKIWKTTNRGNNWTLITPSYPAGSPGQGMIASPFILDSNFFGFGTFNTPLRVVFTSNGGTNWTFSQIPGTLSGAITSIAFNSDKTIGLVGTQSTSTKIAKTTNGGLNWALLTIPSTVSKGCCNIKYVPGTNSAYLVVSSSTKTEGYNSSDNGSTWSANTFPSGTNGLTGLSLSYTPGDSPTNQAFVFSTGTVGSTYYMNDSPMPVEMKSFTSKVSGNDVTLKWTTNEEKNNSGFEIYRTPNGEDNWTKLGFIKGNGTKNTSSDYSFKDTKLNSGKYNYRIKQIDYNGNFEYFALNSTIEIGAPQKYILSQNYPNPFNPTTKIDYQISKDARVKIVVYDVTGKEIITLFNDNQKAGYYTLQMDATNISSGNYFYRMITTEPDGKENIISKKMTVVK